MAINFILAPAWDTDPQVEAMGRSWVGWDPTRTDAELWDTNRGVWRLSKKRVADERYATLSYGGVVQVVARIDGAETYIDGTTPKTALVGEVLQDTHPVSLALLGRPVPAQRNPVAYLDTSDVDHLDGRAEVRPPRSDEGTSAARTGFLLTYNPDRWSWDEDEVAAAVDATARGGRFKDSWSTGSRSSGIAPGDRAFLLRQGREPRGIVASGVFRSTVFEASHFDDERGGFSNYAHVDWDTVLHAEDTLPLEVLQTHVPNGAWTPLASGTRIAADVLGELEVLWARHLDPLGRDDEAPGQRGGQGWVADTWRRRQVEEAAQERLMTLYRENDWHVVDTHIGHPYDARATRGSETRYLEAKGTVTAGHSVLVTRGEVEHARAHAGECVLGILSDVQFEGENLVPGSGRFRVVDWNPGLEDLAPMTYAYTPPVDAGAARDLTGAPAPASFLAP